MEKLSTSELIKICCTENDRYRRGQLSEDQYSLELFRRAIVEQDQQAWEAIHEQYWRLIAKWVNGPTDQVHDRVQTAYLKFLKAIHPHTFDNKFATIGHLMAFLRCCAHSVKVDDARRVAREELYGPFISWDNIRENKMAQESESALERLSRKELLAYIEQSMLDDQERLVMRLSLLGYAPKQIAEKAKHTFRDVKEVYKIKERILSRLSNDPRLHSQWQL